MVILHHLCRLSSFLILHTGMPSLKFRRCSGRCSSPSLRSLRLLITGLSKSLLISSLLLLPALYAEHAILQRLSLLVNVPAFTSVVLEFVLEANEISIDDDAVDRREEQFFGIQLHK